MKPVFALKHTVVSTERDTDIPVCNSPVGRNAHVSSDFAHNTRSNVTMPGPGKATSGTSGEGFLDIHLNATTRWKDVPEPVWQYTLGGYQVLKKWLSYRESALLGRPLTSDETQQFTHHVRRIAVLLKTNPELDTHYRASSGVIV